MSPTARTTLEPLAGPVVAIALMHVLLGMLLWIFLPLWKEAHPSRAGNALLDWKTPDDFLLGRPSPAASQPPTAAVAATPKPAPVKPAATESKVTQSSAAGLKPVAAIPAAGPPATIMTAPPQAGGPSIPANKYIAVSSRSEDYGVNMDTVDDAVQKAYLREWTAPPIESVPVATRSASLRVSIGRDGTVLAAKISKAAGAAALDSSIQQAAEQVQKIPVSLPASFPKERYDLQVNFLIE